VIGEWLNEAVAHHAAGRLQPAEALYRRILGADPSQKDALNLLGVAFAQQGRPEEALVLMDRAVAADPGFPDFHANRGNVLAALGRKGEAAVAYHTALRLDPADGSVWERLGRLLREGGDRVGAATALAEAARRTPGDGPLAAEARAAEAAVAALLDRVTVVRPCRGAELRFIPHDAFVGRALDLYGEFSPEEGRMLAQLAPPGGTVLEVGANIGAHTVALAKAVGPKGRVVAWEPQGLIHRILADNLARNGLGWAEARRAGAGAEAGFLAVPEVDYASPSNFGELALGTAGGSVVPVERIDDLRLSSVSLIKVDVEGMELQVLRGAAETIARCRPVLYVENDRQDRSADLIRCIRGFGYRLWWHMPLLVAQERLDDRTGRALAGYCSANMVCVPAELSSDSNLLEVLSEDETPAAAMQRAKERVYATAAADISRADELRRAGRMDEAEALLRETLATVPGSPPALLALAATLRECGRLGEAETAACRAVAHNPGSGPAYRELGEILRQKGETETALVAFQEAHKRLQGDASSELGMALCLLRLGRWREGFARYHARWQVAGRKPRHGHLPPWTGEPGRRLLVWHDQGHGDTIQCLRFLPGLRDLSASVVAEVPASLAPLVRVPGVEVTTVGATVDGVDAQISFMDLPGLLGIEPSSVPWPGPYVAPDPARRERWADRTGGGPRVGLVWRGNPAFADDRWRSPGLEALAPLFTLPGVRWVGLQAGAGRGDLARGPVPPGFADLGGGFADWADTAAAAVGLDAVVTADTGPAHLAGALGVPTFILLPTASDWRWLDAGATTPWYPSARLFRQRAPGDWTHPVAEARAALAGLLGIAERA